MIEEDLRDYEDLPPGPPPPEDEPPVPYDTRTADQWMEEQKVIPASDMAGAPVPILRAKGNQASIEYGEGNVVDLSTPETPAPEEPKFGRHADREKFRKYVVDKMFGGEDPVKIDPAKVAEQARREYMQSHWGNKPFYEIQRMGKETIKMIEKEANRAATEAYNAAIKVKAERGNLLKDYLSRFDKDMAPPKPEKRIWVSVEGQNAYLPESQVIELQKQGYRVDRPIERPRPTAGRGPKWAKIDGQLGLYTEDEIRQAQAQGSKVEPVSQTRPEADINIRRQRAINIVRNGMKAFQPGERIPPGTLAEWNRILADADVAPIVESESEITKYREIPFIGYKFGQKPPEKSGKYYYSFQGGGQTFRAGEDLPEPPESPTQKRAPVAGATTNRVKYSNGMEMDVDESGAPTRVYYKNDVYPVQVVKSGKNAGRRYIVFNGQGVWVDTK